MDLDMYGSLYLITYQFPLYPKRLLPWIQIHVFWNLIYLRPWCRYTVYDPLGWPFSVYTDTDCEVAVYEPSFRAFVAAWQLLGRQLLKSLTSATVRPANIIAITKNFFIRVAMIGWSASPIDRLIDKKRGLTLPASIEKVVGNLWWRWGNSSPRYSARTALLSSHHCENFLRFLNKR